MPAAHARPHHELPPPPQSPGKPTSAAELSGCWRDHRRAGKATLPHFPAEAGGRPTPTQAGVARICPPLVYPQLLATYRGSSGWLCSPGQNRTATAFCAKAPIIPVKTTQPYLLRPLLPHLTPRTEASTYHCQRPRNSLSTIC